MAVFSQFSYFREKAANSMPDISRTRQLTPKQPRLTTLNVKGKNIYNNNKYIYIAYLILWYTVLFKALKTSKTHISSLFISSLYQEPCLFVCLQAWKKLHSAPLKISPSVLLSVLVQCQFSLVSYSRTLVGYCFAKQIGEVSASFAELEGQALSD